MLGLQIKLRDTRNSRKTPRRKTGKKRQENLDREKGGNPRETYRRPKSLAPHVGEPVGKAAVGDGLVHGLLGHDAVEQAHLVEEVHHIHCEPLVLVLACPDALNMSRAERTAALALLQYLAEVPPLRACCRFPAS
eukprot:scaffold1237_cov243-Pinguiococcus_pyrenoidosus.AAC.25